MILLFSRLSSSNYLKIIEIIIIKKRPSFTTEFDQLLVMNYLTVDDGVDVFIARLTIYIYTTHVYTIKNNSADMISAFTMEIKKKKKYIYSMTINLDNTNIIVQCYIINGLRLKS